MPRQIVTTNAATNNLLTQFGGSGAGQGTRANEADFLNDAGGQDIGPGIQGEDQYSIAQLEAARAKRDADRAGRYGVDAEGNILGANTVYGTPIAQGGTATGFETARQDIGTVNAATGLGNVGTVWSAQIDPATGLPMAGAPLMQNQGMQGGDHARQVGQIIPGTDVIGTMARTPGLQSESGMTVNSDGSLVYGGSSATSPGVAAGAPLPPPMPAGFGAPGAGFTPGARPAADAFGTAPPQQTLSDTGIPQAAAPINRAPANAALATTNQATNQILGQSQQGLNLSVAQAQLAQNAQNAQSAALGLARSGNRRDRALLERQAIGEGAAIQSQAGQASAILRAQEEQANQEFRVKAAETAGRLGLDQAAAQVNMEALDLNAATDYINQRFQATGLNRQLNQQEAQRVTNYLRDQKLIEKDYQAMDLAHQEAIDRELTARYGIDQQTYVALKGVKDEPGFWENLLTGAAGTAATVGVGALVSDERLKTNVRAVDSTDRDFEEFVASIQPREYEYRDPTHGEGPRLGLMAQDLERTRFGRALVRESGGVKTIDVPALTGGVAAGLRLAFDRIADLESALKETR